MEGKAHPAGHAKAVKGLTWSQRAGGTNPNVEFINSFSQSQLDREYLLHSGINLHEASSDHCEYLLL